MTIYNNIRYEYEEINLIFVLGTKDQFFLIVKKINYNWLCKIYLFNKILDWLADNKIGLSDL